MDISNLHGSIYSLPEAPGNFMEGAQKKVVFSPERFLPGYVLRCWIVAPGKGERETHQHPWPHWVVVLNGKGCHCIDGQVFYSEPGEWAFIPGDVPHYFYNCSDTEDLSLLCMVPPEGDVAPPSDGE